MAASVTTAIDGTLSFPTALAERRMNRVSWAILMAGVLLIVGSAAHLAYRLALPTDGWSFTSGAIGTALEDTITYDRNLLGLSSPIQAGDFVLAVEGYPYSRLLDNAVAGGPSLVPDWRTRTTARYIVQRGEGTVALDVPLRRWEWWDVLRIVFAKADMVVRLFDVAIGLCVFLLRPHEWAARILFFLSTVGMAISISGIINWGLPEIIYPPVFWGAVLLGNWIYGALAAPTLLLLALSFPRPKRFVRRRPVATTFVLYGVLPSLVLVFGAHAFLGWGWTATCGALSLASIVHTLMSAKDRVSRAQLRWAGLGVFGLALSVALSAIGGFKLYPPSFERLLLLVDPVLQLMLPTALAVAILRYRLFDIDIILNRALVYGTLTACVVGLYVGIVTYLGLFFGGTDDLVASLVATGVVAVAFQPLRTWLQRGITRLMFGQRDEPYSVIASLGRQLETTLAPDDVYAAIVQTIGQTLKLPFVAITIGDEGKPHATYRQPSDTAQRPPAHEVRLPLVYHNRAVGVLHVAPRAGEARFTDAERKLLDDLARQTGIAVYAAQMTADVQRSRERIVVAREEERRRLRRDLHDGLGPHLASQTLTLDVIVKLVRNDPDQAEMLLSAVREQMQQAVGDIRDLIYGLRPPVLDDLGLHGAMEEWIERLRQQHPTLDVRLRLPATPALLPAAVEVAAYRILQEATANVVRHAQASSCVVVLERHMEDGDAQQDVRLVLDISDDGRGIAPDHVAGVGLHSMRERCDELGGQLVVEPRPNGGTRVRAILPMLHLRHVDDYSDPPR
jgi:signal transduction histidine kinase